MKITVVIPTVAGRTKYLASAIATCTAQAADNLEILISDNSPGDAESTVRAIADPRIRYIRPPHFMTMSAHWEFVLDNVTGDSVVFIGDDDGLMPGAIAHVDAIHAAHGNVLIHHSLCNYWWPDHPRIGWRNSAALMHDPRAPGGWQSSSEFLTEIAAGNRRYFDGPGIYQNFIPMPLINQIRASGPFFRRAIPDVWSALALTANTDRFYSSRHFLTIGGQGAKSNGALVHSGSSDGSTFSTATTANPLFTPRSPSRTVPALLIDSLLETAKQFDRPDIAAAIDYPQLLQEALVECLSMDDAATRRREITETLRIARRNGALTGLAAAATARIAAAAARRVGLAAPRPQRGLAYDAPLLRFDGSVTDIASAARAVAAHLAAHAPA